MHLIRSAVRKLFNLSGIPQQLAQQTQTLQRIESLAGKLASIEKKLQAQGEAILQLQNRDNYVDRGTQYLLADHYQRQAASGKIYPFPEIEFRNHAQSGDDGILLYIFSLIGTHNRKCVEICAGNGMQCNSANLIINHGWQGLLCEGNERLARLGNDFYRRHPDTLIVPPTFLNEWITIDNVNELMARHGFTDEIDLLSIDIDGIDYWLWKAIDSISPRVVVVEVNPIWGCEEAVTVPYDPAFQNQKVYDGDTMVAHYCGASLPAFVKLAREKGYRLIGSNLYGFNAFFLRDDLGQDLFPEIDPESCFAHPAVQWANLRGRPFLAQMNWQKV